MQHQLIDGQKCSLGVQCRLEKERCGCSSGSFTLGAVQFSQLTSVDVTWRLERAYGERRLPAGCCVLQAAVLYHRGLWSMLCLWIWSTPHADCGWRLVVTAASSCNSLYACSD